MIHMIQKAKDQVLALTNAAYEAAVAAGKLPADVAVRANVEIPKDPTNGDYTTTFALAAAKAMKKSPREIAGVLLENLNLTDSYFASADVYKRQVEERRVVVLCYLPGYGNVIPEVVEPPEEEQHSQKGQGGDLVLIPVGEPLFQQVVEQSGERHAQS